MNPFTLLAALFIGWLARRSIAGRVERRSLLLLRRGSDGIIDGARPIERRNADTRRAVLILHGFGDTPQTVAYLADYLHGLGFTVRAPLLAGHGRTLREFGSSTAADWLGAARHELDALHEEYEAVGVVGLSMGGALSVILAADAARERRVLPDALVLIAPYLSMRPRARRIAAFHWMLSPFIQYLPSREQGSIRDEAERRNNLGFGTVTPRVLDQLQRLVSRARRALAGVTVPTLVLQSRADNRIDPGAAGQSFERLGAAEKRFEWTEGGHVITVDTGRERVFALTGEWLLARVGRPGARSPGDTVERGGDG